MDYISFSVRNTFDSVHPTGTGYGYTTAFCDTYNYATKSQFLHGRSQILVSPFAHTDSTGTGIPANTRTIIGYDTSMKQNTHIQSRPPVPSFFTISSYTVHVSFPALSQVNN